MTSTNLNIVLTNALCCISAQATKVSKLYSIGDKCAESELIKLKLMNDWFEALKCYKPEPIKSKFKLKILHGTRNDILTDISALGSTYYLTVNDVVYGFAGNNSTLVLDVLQTLMTSAVGITSYNVITDPSTFNPRYVNFLVEANCDIQSINFKRIKGLSNIEFSNNFSMYQQGYCTPINCLTDEQYENIFAKLMKECDICECQLTQ